MELQTISQISKAYNLSTRALRYYEQIGLIQSEKKEDYAYRVYSEETVKRIQQILVLRKLRIPLKQISEILQSEDVVVIIDAFQKNLSEVDEEITALSTIRDIISGFITRLNESVNADIKLNLLEDTDLLEAVDSLTVRQMPLKEEKTAGDLQAASEKLDRLTDRNVRIVYLPPMTVAAAHYIGDGCEGVVYGQINEFIIKNDLLKKKPDLRAFGFNNPIQPIDKIGFSSSGYETWVTIPDDMDVSAPLVKKQFTGGLYAAHMIPMGAFEEWQWLREWVLSNDKYDPAWGEVRFTPYDDGTEWAFEEPLNYYNTVKELKSGAETQQLDLLFPIKPKENNHVN